MTQRNELPAGIEEWVLVVDDEEDVLETIAEMIRLTGLRCVTARSVSDAVEMVKLRSFDLVITDMHMPGESGLDLIERIRRIDDSIPIILITGFPSINMAINAMKRGAIDFLTKPFDMETITHLAAKALRERRLRREIRRLQEDVDKTATIEKLHRDVNEKYEELRRLYDISESMNQFMDTGALLRHVVQLASRVTGAQRISLMLLDRSQQFLKIRASLGIPEEVIRTTRVRVGEAISGGVAENGHSMRATKQTKMQYAAHDAALGLGQYGSQSWLSMPIRIGGELFGVINLTDKPDRADFDIKDEHVMEILAEKVGTKLENQALNEGIYANLIDTLNSLVTTIEAKDPYTREHSHRVSEYSARIAQLLELGQEDIEMIEFAALLHDIGKIGVRDEILMCPGALSDEAYESLKQHPIIGEKIVEPLGLSAAERSIIRNHHERFDGRGYPDGLQGVETPLFARIVSIADAFDAMTSTRPYRMAKGTAEALAEIRRNRGTQFDPDLADLMIEAIEAGRFLPRFSAEMEAAPSAR